MSFRLKNLPVPESYVTAIILTLLLQLLFPLPVFDLPRIGHLAGWPLMVTGILVSLWSASEAGRMHIESPDELLTTDPYAHSRNPMYVGWALIYLGFTFVLNSVWSAVLFPAAFLYVHIFEIRREEQFLKDRFGTQYEGYRKRARRYL